MQLKFQLLRKIVLILFTPFMVFMSGKSLGIAEIDSALEKTKDDMKIFRLFFPEMIDINLKLSSASENINYKKGAIKSYVETSRYLFNQSKYIESLSIIDKANILNKDFHSNELQSSIYTEYGKNYQKLGFYEKSIENYNLALKYIKKSDSSPAQINYNLKYIYGCKVSVFQIQNIKDSLNMNLIKSDKASLSPLISARLARYFILHKNDGIKALHYLKNAEYLLKYQNNIRDKSIILRIYGLYFFKLNDYSKSELYYNQSIAISRKLGIKQDENITLKMLYESYIAECNLAKQFELLQNNDDLREQLVRKEKKTMSKVIKTVKDEEENTFKRLIFLAIILTVICLLVIGWVFTRKIYSIKLYKKLQSISENEIKENHVRIQHESNFNEIIKLAKQNHPDYYIRFQDIHPTFESRLLSVYPQLKNNDLIFLSLVFLNFESKEIAEMTFKSTRTVQNKKYLLRKKLNIPTSDNISVWLKEQFE